MNRYERRAIDNCDVIIDAMQGVKVALPEIFKRTKYAASDGYPKSSMGGPGQRGSVSRPTETTALSRPESDPVLMAAKDIVRILNELAKTATVVNDKRRVALVTPVVSKACVNCSQCLPIAGDGRCDTCYRYFRRRGIDRYVKEST